MFSVCLENSSNSGSAMFAHFKADPWSPQDIYKFEQIFFFFCPPEHFCYLQSPDENCVGKFSASFLLIFHSRAHPSTFVSSALNPPKEKKDFRTFASLLRFSHPQRSLSVSKGKKNG